MAQHFDTVDEYIASFPAEVKDPSGIRRRCLAAVPDSGEVISYGIPRLRSAASPSCTSPAGHAMCRCTPYPGDDVFRLERSLPRGQGR